MISQYFTGSTALLIVQNRLRCSFAEFKLCADFLNFFVLLFETRSKSF
jgi:hypothetical protein